LILLCDPILVVIGDHDGVAFPSRTKLARIFE
jgi:hypothetical protein